ncbi:acid protease [Gyrodon lividus]|nr:acid protease [Gyrodon lividus]
MHFTLVTALTALPFFVAASPQRVKQEARGTAIPLYKRSSLVNANVDKSVNLQALNSHVASTRTKILRGFNNFEKNTSASHPSAVKRASGGLPLFPFDVANIWFGTVTVGTPPRMYTVVFDTGSRHVFLIWCVDCDASCHGHATYDPDSSSTSVNLEEPFSTEYGIGDSAFGQQYTDNVTIVGLTATRQTFGVALHYSEGLRQERFTPDGVMGMAFQPISEYHEGPVFQTLVTQGQTDEPVFAFNFADPRPELYLGGTNPDMYTGGFTYTQVTEIGYWRIGMDVVLNGEVFLRNVDSIIDTGTELIHGLPEDVATFYDAIGGTPRPGAPDVYAFRCDDVPSVSFSFDGTPFPIPAEFLSIGYDNEDPSKCYGSIIAGYAEIPFWIIGAVFLDHVYTVFDVAKARVGFAMLA